MAAQQHEGEIAGSITTSPSIYVALVALGVAIDHHESDLYVPVTPDTTKLVENYSFRANVEMFRDVYDRDRLWYDIPFAYDPWWEERGMTPLGVEPLTEAP